VQDEVILVYRFEVRLRREGSPEAVQGFGLLRAVYPEQEHQTRVFGLAPGLAPDGV
jgi:hypothetical protein